MNEYEEAELAYKATNVAKRGGWWVFVSIGFWFAGVVYLFFHLKWGNPTDPPLARLTAALTTEELIVTASFFIAALLIHHHLIVKNK